MPREEYNRADERRALGEPACPPERYGLIGYVARGEPRDPVSISNEDGPLAIYFAQADLATMRPAEVMPDLLLEALADFDARPGDFECVMFNEVPEWQVDPDEPPISREEGLRRITAASPPAPGVA